METLHKQLGDKMTSPHKSTLRKSLRSALSHKKLADELLDSLADSQTKFNSLVSQLNGQAKGVGNTATSAHLITDIFEADGTGTEAQHKSTLRKSLRSALSHKKLADEIADSMEELATAQNALSVKLDADLAIGAYSDTDYASTLTLAVSDPDAEGSDAQHKQSFRKSLKSALVHSRLADQILDSIADMQTQYNAALAILDTAYAASAFAAVSSTPIDPDAT